LLTYADLEAFPDDGLRRELLDGELIVSPSPFVRHQEVLGRLHLALGGFVAEHGGGKVYVAPLDVVLSDTNVFEPDLLFIVESQLGIMTRKNIQGPPSLAIEVVSDSRMDRVRKRKVYERFGVPEYWVVDPDADRVEIYRLEGEQYARPEIVEPPDEITYPLLEGLRVSLESIFAR
jgi:Uma2 family endonuclease